MEKINQDWIKKGINNDAIQHSQQLAAELCSKDLTMNQLRNWYSEINRIRLQSDFDKRSALLLLPKLHYAIARTTKVEAATLIKETMIEATKLAAESADNFSNYADYMESLIAFFKFSLSSKKNN